MIIAAHWLAPMRMISSGEKEVRFHGGACLIILLLVSLSLPTPFLARTLAGQRSQESSLSQLEAARDHNKQGVELTRRGDHLEAAKEFQTATQLWPAYALAYYNLGVAMG